jgi:signal peptidase I
MTEAADGAAKKRDSETNIKETIESILIAFILAFMFRAFVVEAFVIPTGSMATTLLGAHMRFTCEDCGYPFDVSFQSPSSDEGDTDVPRTSGKTYSLRCPNCGFKVPRTNDANPENRADNTPVHYGDRILVLKYLYLLDEPRRWDVVVFKSPDDPEHHDYSQNYIKRLVGLPGEAVMILDGDIYTAPSADAGDIRAYEIRRKPRNAQNVLWRVVYDNDFRSTGRERNWTDRDGVPFKDKPWNNPWQVQPGEQGWDLGETPARDRVFKFNRADGGGSIRFAEDVSPATDPLTDVMWYDATWFQRGGHDSYNDDSYRGDQNVSDIKLEFYYQRSAGDGELKVSLNKLDNQFVVVLAPGKATLLVNGREAGKFELSDDFSKPAHVEIENCDYRITVRLDDAEVLSYEYQPDTQRLLKAFESRERLPKPHIRIFAEKQTSELSHIKLWRDIYYGNRPARTQNGEFQWASPYKFPLRVAKLGDDDFFVCGDNSPLSGDARIWSSPISLPTENLSADAGRVPRRFMLGKAFFVYWPSGYRPLRNAPAIAPNFGEMRFIH